MDILEKLFGSLVRVRLMKLFLFNEETFFKQKDIEKKVQGSNTTIKKELNLLVKIGLVKNKTMIKEGKILKNGKKGKKTKISGFILNSDFKYINPLKSMFVETSAQSKKKIAEKISKAGRIKFLLLSGVFIQSPDSRVDMLIAGDDIKKDKMKKIILAIEADLGRELKYSIFRTEDMIYRLGITDRLMRDIFDYPHEVLIDRLRV